MHPATSRRRLRERKVPRLPQIRGQVHVVSLPCDPPPCAPTNGRLGFPFGFPGAGGRLPKARRGRFFSEILLLLLLLLGFAPLEGGTAHDMKRFFRNGFFPWDFFVWGAAESRLTQLREAPPRLGLVAGPRGPTQIHIRGLCHWAGEPAGHHIGAERHRADRRAAVPASGARKPGKQAHPVHTRHETRGVFRWSISVAKRHCSTHTHDFTFQLAISTSSANVRSDPTTVAALSYSERLALAAVGRGTSRATNDRAAARFRARRRDCSGGLRVPRGALD